MSNVVKKLTLSVMNARNLIRTIQASQERQKKSEIRRLRRIRHMFEELTKEYDDAVQEAGDDYNEAVEALMGKPDAERNPKIAELNRELSNNVNQLNEEKGKCEVVLKLTPDDFNCLKRKWDACEDFLPSVDVQDFVEDVEVAFEKVEDLDLDKLKESEE